MGDAVKTKVLMTLLLFCLSLSAAEFVWRANTEANLAGYKLYQGPSTGVYTNHIVIGWISTNYTLAVEGTNFFALTAFNKEGLESLPTADLMYVGPMRPSTPVGFEGLVLWLITEQSCDWIFFEPTITNEIASFWPAEVFRQKMIRKPLSP